MKPSFTHSLIHSFILGAIAAITLTLSSCEPNDPNPEVQPDGVSFQLKVQKTTPDSAVILVVPPTLQTEFFWAHVTQKYLNNQGQSLLQYVQSYLKPNTYDGLKKSGRIMVGKQIIQLTSLQNNTDYRFIVCQVDKDLNVIDKPASVQFTTPRGMPSEGLLSGVFSAANGKKIRFAKGNLQYQASTATWRFAEHQYDMIGADNKLIADTYDGWIDLFGWNTARKPTLCSNDDADYTGPFVDWGTREISNGGNKANQWRTLTYDDWGVIFTGRDMAWTKFGLGRIYLNDAKTDSVKGLILMPDDFDWQDPKGLHFSSAVGCRMEWNAEKGWFEDPDKDHMLDNAYTLDEWAKMEQHGAVFFPASGARSGKMIMDVNDYARYWTPDMYEGDDSGYRHILYYHPSAINPFGRCQPRIGCSVRLAWEIE